MSQLEKGWLKIAAEYVKERGEDKYLIADVVAWAHSTKRWEPDPTKVLKIAKKELAEALRNAEVVDPQGRKVRQFISAKMKQGDLWAEFSTAAPELAIEHFRQNERHIRDDIGSHRTRLQSWNDNYRPGGYAPIQMPLFDSDSEAEAA